MGSTRIALVSSEPVRPRMAGIGIRYFELARRLAERGIGVRLVSPAEPGEIEIPGVEVRRFERGRLTEILAGCDAAVAQGQLANDVRPRAAAASGRHRPLRSVADREPDLRRHPRPRSVPQRPRHLGAPDVARRLLPLLVRGAADLLSGLPRRAGPGQSRTPGGGPGPGDAASRPSRSACRTSCRRTGRSCRRAEPGERRLLFGGLYDWYDPWTLLDALRSVGIPGWTLLLIRNPNADSTPQRLLGEVEARCRQLGWWGSRVQDARLGAGRAALRPAARRRPPGRAAPAEPGDPPVAPHPLSRRPRRRLPGRHQRRRHHEPAAARAWRRLGGADRGRGGARRSLDERCSTADEPALDARRQGARELLRAFTWDRALAPLLRFCREPRRDETKDRFVHRPETVAPPDSFPFRLKRRRSPLGIVDEEDRGRRSSPGTVATIWRPVSPRSPASATPASTGRSWCWTTARSDGTADWLRKTAISGSPASG